MRHRFAIPLLLAEILAIPLRSLPAQGVAGAAVGGSIVSEPGKPIPNARVSLLETATGIARSTTTRDDGLFGFENITVGGPYRLEVRAVGFEPASLAGIILHIGDRLEPRIVLHENSTHRLDTVLIRGSALRDAGAGGPAYSIPGEAARNLPLLNRDFVGLFAMVPQATGTTAYSISGQHSRFNSIQVDGGSAGDFFGVNVTPGSAAGAKSLSVEAIEEIRVLVAPFDVRQGGFSGGLINAATRSGTNTFHGSSLISFANASLVGRDTADSRTNNFYSAQYGLTLGGPIHRDRLHFFLAADFQSRRSPFEGPSVFDPATGISLATAQKAETIFRDKYGFNAGGAQSPAIEAPNANVFAKISGELSPHHRFALTQNVVSARTDNLNRTVRDRNNRDGWQLSESGFTSRTRALTTRLGVNSDFGNVSNEIIASFGTVSDDLESENRIPLFLAQADLPNIYLAGGSVKNAQGTETKQRIVELTDNLSWNRGNHLFTAGTQNQFLHFHDNFFLGSWGVWTFASVDALDQQNPSRYEIALPLRPGGPLADYSSEQIAGYVQDRWTVTSRFTLTGGLRIDVPFSDAPLRNDALASNGQLGNIDTSVFPSGNPVWSPRLGFSYVIGPQSASMLRGGIGRFSGHPPFAWPTNAYSNTGRDQTLLVCNPSNGVPAPTTDINNLPDHCLNSSTPGASVPSVTYFSPDFRFQQATKYVIGIDHDFGGGFTASFDVIRTNTANTLFVRDINLVELGPNAEGRVMYGTITNSGLTRPARLDSLNFGSIYRFGNRSGDRSTSVTLVADKHWQSGGLLEIGYNWSRTVDLMSLAGFNGLLISQNNPIDGSLTSRRLRTSARDIPQNLVITLLAPPVRRISASLFYHARSGTPYAYVANGDANADGTQSNDLAYVPMNQSDVTLTNPEAFPALDAFIESERCLSSERGRVMRRNSCRNPSVQRLDARLGSPISFGGGRTLELSADFYNVMNMLNRDWGLARETSNKEEVSLLSVAGWDAVANRPRYTVPSVLPSRDHVVIDDSRWRIQLGGRYTF
ncbi:MAG: TonB-dependent receptor domain-containing protein [Gemmatimonadaceae bacterium]